MVRNSFQEKFVEMIEFDLGYKNINITTSLNLCGVMQKSHGEFVQFS